MVDRVDHFEYERPALGGRRREAVLTRCEELKQRIRAAEERMAAAAKERREAVIELTAQRRRLWITSRRRAREPGPDGAVQLPPIPHGAMYLWGRRLRAACQAILSRSGAMSLIELHVLLHRHGFAVAGSHPVKALADALGHENDVGRARRVRRGCYVSLVPASNRPLWPGGPVLGPAAA